MRPPVATSLCPSRSSEGSKHVEHRAIEQEIRTFLQDNFPLSADGSRPRPRRLPDRGRSHRLDRRPRADRLHRGALRDRDRRRGGPSREPRLDREHRPLRRREDRRGGAERCRLAAVAASAPARRRGRTVDEIVERLREVVDRDLRRRGAVVGLSGGIDSASSPSSARGRFGAGARARACSCRRASRPPTRSTSGHAGRGSRGSRDGARGHHAAPRRRPAATSAATRPSAP